MEDKEIRRGTNDETENDALLMERLKELRQVDIRTVDPAELVDMSSVTISPELPAEERVKDYIRQIKNPYCYVSHGIVIKISFMGTRKLEECLKDCVALDTCGSEKTVV